MFTYIKSWHLKNQIFQNFEKNILKTTFESRKDYIILFWIIIHIICLKYGSFFFQNFSICHFIVLSIENKYKYEM